MFVSNFIPRDPPVSPFTRNFGGTVPPMKTVIPTKIGFRGSTIRQLAGTLITCPILHPLYSPGTGKLKSMKTEPSVPQISQI